MRKQSVETDSDIKTFLETVEPCDCGRPDCLVCMAQRFLQEPQNQISKGNQKMTSDQDLQEIAAQFVNGSEYLRKWRADAELRNEFDSDFLSWCHYEAACSNGQVRSI